VHHKKLNAQSHNTAMQETGQDKQTIKFNNVINKQNKPSGLSPRMNYTDRATAALMPTFVDSVAWSARRIPTAVFSVF
jgi:hypothetical protein